MAKLIDIQDFSNYRAELNKAIEHLESVENQLLLNMFNLATTGKWKNWNNQQNEGDIFECTEEMLRNTGDENIDKLFEIFQKVSDVKSELSLKNNLK